MELYIDQFNEVLGEAKSYYKILERGQNNKKKFNNDLLYNIASMSLEKFLVAGLLKFDIMPTHHTPMALLKELKAQSEVPEEVISATKLLARFESICSFDGFGYRTPTDDDIQAMTKGLGIVNQFIDQLFH